MDELVSVIIPVFNAEKYLRDSVESVVNQTYTKLELIIVDDGSTDASGQLCDDYAKQDSRIHVFHKANGGASSARNFGMRKAVGDYIYFLDCDDYIEPDALQTLVSLANENKVDCVYFEAYNFSESETVVANKNGFTFHVSYPISSGSTLIPKLLRNKDYHAGPVLYFTKASILNDMHFEEGIMMEDELFSFQLLLKCNSVLCLRQKFYRRRMREGSVMTSTGKELFRFHSISRVMNKVINMYKQDRGIETQKYLERIGLLWLSRYDDLTKTEKKEAESEFTDLKQKTIQLNYFNSFQLRIRFWGYWVWFVLTVPNKVYRKVRLRLIR